MASKKCSIIFVVIFFCMLNFSSMALARNINDASQLYSFSDEKGLNKRVLVEEKRRSPCKSGRSGQVREARDNPRCHNFL
ncbi:unnamed protein product [Lathyrus oleraceus]